MEGKKVLLLGLGFFQRGVLESLSDMRSCILVDSNAEVFSRFDIEDSRFETVVGEASSIVTWKRIDLENVSHIVSSLQDFDVVIEVCRIIRDVKKLDIPLIILWYGDAHIEELEQYGVKIINPLHIGVEAVLSNIEKNYSKPTNIGLGLGEIVEVSILRRSHLVDRKMRYLQPNRWRVCAAYRDGKLLMPDADFKLKVGDKAVIIGDPKVIENIVNILTKGTPEFPLQYGQSMAILGDNLTEESVDEFAFVAKNTRVRKLQWHTMDNVRKYPESAISKLEKAGFKKDNPLKSFRNIPYIKDIGIVGISGIKNFTLLNTKMRYFFKRTVCPFLISRATKPYDEIIISLNSTMPDRLIEIGAELSLLYGIPFKVIYVTPPGALKSSTDENAIKERHQLVNNYENLTRSKVEYHQLEGNPVRETLSILDKSPDALLVVSSDSENRITWLTPHVPYLLAGFTKNSVLVLPHESQNE